MFESPSRPPESPKVKASLFLSAVVFHVKLLSIQEILTINTERFLKEINCLNAVDAIK